LLLVATLAPTMLARADNGSTENGVRPHLQSDQSRLGSIAHPDNGVRPHLQSDQSRRGPIADQLREEASVVEKTIITVDDKVKAADEVRLERVRAAYRLLHDTTTDPVIVARRRAVARWLLERDREERELLADETAKLRVAATIIKQAIDKVPTLTLPAVESLARPVKGTIARKFGMLVHDASKAKLARRGLDFEVEDQAVVIVPADGVVKYAGPIRGLDSGVIIDHGDYLTVTAKLGDVALPVGTKLGKGDRLGHAARHRVYFEVRVKAGPGGVPVDPEPLIETRAK
jgi:septal ring factor EnvC (AmiA/AmiB activator)